MSKTELKKFTMTAGEYKDIPCTAPCTLYSVLLSNGYINDVFYGRNIETAAEGIPASAVFSSTISISQVEANSRHVYLKLSGVYAHAEIFFNDRSYGTVNSPDRISYFDITDMVKVGDNRLDVKCLRALSRKSLIKKNGELSGEFEMAPYIADMGLVGACEMLCTNSALIKGVRVSQKHAEGKVTLGVEVDTLGTTDDVRTMATLVSPTGKIYFGGVVSGKGSITVPDPEYWWPASLGNPLRYKLSVTLYNGDMAADTYQCSIGLRSISVEPNENGIPTVTINGARIFSMGATYVRENSVIPNINKNNTERLIKQAVAANMNTLRVIGEGYTPGEHFYSLCDKYGLLVWQELSVPYVSDNVAGAFAAGITDAVRDTASRLSTHPSVALTYLSVVECSGGDHANGADEVAEFRKVAERILSPVVEHYGAGVPFVADAASLFTRDEKYIFAKNYELEGSAVPALPEVESIRAFAPEDEINLMSPTVEAHCNCESAVRNMLSNMYNCFRFPSGIEELSYVSSLSEAYSAEKSIKSVRMHRDECTSAVCRQLNDGWPAISPAAVDFYGRKKAIMYLASRFFAPVCVFVEPKDKEMRFFVSNETRKEYSGKLFYAIYSSDSSCIKETRLDVSIPPFSSALVAEDDFDKYMSSDPSKYYVIYELFDSRGISHSGVVLFTPPKRHDFRDPEISAEIIGSGKSFDVKLTAKRLAQGVKISFRGIDVQYSDNYIDITGNAPAKIHIETSETVLVKDLVSRLVINTSYSIGR